MAQIDPVFLIDALSVRNLARSSSDSTATKIQSESFEAVPIAIFAVRSRSSSQNPGSWIPRTETTCPFLTPSLSINEGGWVIFAAHFRASLPRRSVTAGPEWWTTSRSSSDSSEPISANGSVSRNSPRRMTSRSSR